MNPFLKPYVPVAELIAGTFGKDVEVILHDLTKPQHSVVYVANDSVTHRKTGTGFRHLILELLKKSDEKEEMVLNYYFPIDDKIIRSSFLLIRDDKAEIIGALCINIDTSKVQASLAWLESLLPGFGEKKVLPSPESLTVNDMVTQIIDRIVEEVNPKKLSREKRLELINFMQTRGVFLMKGSMEYVSQKLGISKVTLYSDLDDLKIRK